MTVERLPLASFFCSRSHSIACCGLPVVPGVASGPFRLTLVSKGIILSICSIASSIILSKPIVIPSIMVHIWFVRFSKLLRFIESILYELLLLPQLSANEILAHAKSFGYRLFEKIHLKAYIPRIILNPIVDLCAYPMAIWYYFNIQVPLSIFRFARRHAKLILDILFRRSFYMRQLLVHAKALQQILYSIWRTIIDTKLSDIVGWCIQAVYDVLYEYLISRRSGSSADTGESMSGTLSYDELAELLDYTECEDTRSEEELSEQSRRIKMLMHQPFPVKPFRVTVRLPVPSRCHSRATSVAGAVGVSVTNSDNNMGSRGVTSEMIADEIGSIASEYIGSKLGGSDNPAVAFVREKLKPRSPKTRRRMRTRTVSNQESVHTSNIDLDHYVSPTSFPTTPFSRSRVMNITSQRVDSTMFNVRDMLRLEEMAESRDTVCRQAAERAKDTGQIAVFDDSVNACDGIALCCGNHCAMKVGKGTCSSCRSTVPILRNCWVYMEFSITVSGSQVPWLAVGLVSTDSPLNVPVGSWQASCAMNSDGQLLIGSRWFQALDSVTMLLPGTTVGMLVYVESQDNMELPQLQTTGFASMFLGGGVTPMRPAGSRGSFSEHLEQVDIEDERSWSKSRSDTGLAAATVMPSPEETEWNESELELKEIYDHQEQAAGASVNNEEIGPIFIPDVQDAVNLSTTDSTRSCLSKSKLRCRHESHCTGNSNSANRIDPGMSPVSHLVCTFKLRLMHVIEILVGLVLWVLSWIGFAEGMFKVWVLLPLFGVNLEMQLSSLCHDLVVELKEYILGPAWLGVNSRKSSDSLNNIGSSMKLSNLGTAVLLRNNASVRRAMNSHREHDTEGEDNFNDCDCGSVAGTNSNEEGSWFAGGSESSPINSSNNGDPALEHILGGGGSGSSESNNQLSALAAACATPRTGRSRIQLKFNINGRLKSFKGAKESQVVLEATGLADRKDVYPCISILSENTRLWNRFCEADIVYKQRSQIGAPPNVKVYCLDGSLLLSEDD